MVPTTLRDQNWAGRWQAFTGLPVGLLANLQHETLRSAHEAGGKTGSVIPFPCDKTNDEESPSAKQWMRASQVKVLITGLRGGCLFCSSCMRGRRKEVTKWRPPISELFPRTIIQFVTFQSVGRSSASLQCVTHNLMNNRKLLICEQ